MIRIVPAVAACLLFVTCLDAQTTWPFQTRAQAGYTSPQDPATLPHSAAAFSTPVAKPAYAGPALVSRASNEWTIAGGWRMAAAPLVKASLDEMSRTDFAADSWYQATVPGTVLTTLIDRGVYPDPDYGLNNMAIPESLNKQDYWYRTEFTLPNEIAGRRLTLTFNGINYLAQVWLNGKPLGSVKGAFIRGVFDVSGVAQPGKPNVLLVMISPPPHPGIPNEQSVKGGPGENGGAMCLDGPTFVATEGWDWIPAIRDRNSGLWQEVTLRVSDAVRILDPKVVTTLPLPDTTHARVSITAPMNNDSNVSIRGTLHAEFEGVSVAKEMTLNAGDNSVTLTPEEFPQLNVAHPRLWWPNGYGAAELYHLKLSFSGPRSESDSKTLRFGIRQITYELSLMDKSGSVRRVEVAPELAMGQPIIGSKHESIIKSKMGWVYSLEPGAENSAAVHPLEDTRTEPYLVIRVNGVRIACKGGNWGMDDSRKRVSREHLEPFFRLHREANLNIIRNWVGQNTEDAFFDLADEYGLLVWNDFWQSTQNYNVEPSDSALFLANAQDTIQRYRNHPSIAVWCGRNEGVPSPTVNEGLEVLARTLDGTRFYAPSSNVINLQNSGPYKYFEPADYFTKFGRGFAVELGIPSFPTLAAFRAFMPKEDQWPPNDDWAYHDWHQSGNGVVAPFMDSLATHYGAATGLEDFERKAQLMNYVAHRALFEGFNAHLWAPNSGRMLWMTQPAWPSTMWQILSSDYSTQASFYGVKKACERIHVQLNLPDLKVAIVNNSNAALRNVMARAVGFSADGKSLFSKEHKSSAAESAVTEVMDLRAEMQQGLVFTKLQLLDERGSELTSNFYWYAAAASDYLQMNGMPSVALEASGAETKLSDSMARITMNVDNAGPAIALMSELTLRSSSDGSRVLPAYFSDNFISLLPGEKRQLTIEYPLGAAHGAVQVGVTGWNVQPLAVEIKR